MSQNYSVELVNKNKPLEKNSNIIVDGKKFVSSKKYEIMYKKYEDAGWDYKDMKEKYDIQVENNNILKADNKKLETLFLKGDNAKKRELVERVDYYQKQYEDLENKYSKNDYANDRIKELIDELDEVKRESNKWYDNYIALQKENEKLKQKSKSNSNDEPEAEDSAYAELQNKYDIAINNNKKLQEKVEFHSDAYYKKLNELNDYKAKHENQNQNQNKNDYVDWDKFKLQNDIVKLEGKLENLQEKYETLQETNMHIEDDKQQLREEVSDLNEWISQNKDESDENDKLKKENEKLQKIIDDNKSELVITNTIETQTDRPEDDNMSVASTNSFNNNEYVKKLTKEELFDKVMFNVYGSKTKKIKGNDIHNKVAGRLQVHKSSMSKKIFTDNSKNDDKLDYSVEYIKRLMVVENQLEKMLNQ